MKKQIAELWVEYREAIYNMEDGDFILAPNIWVQLKLLSEQEGCEKLARSIELVLKE